MTATEFLSGNEALNLPLSDHCYLDTLVKLSQKQQIECMEEKIQNLRAANRNLMQEEKSAKTNRDKRMLQTQKLKNM